MAPDALHELGGKRQRSRSVATLREGPHIEPPIWANLGCLTPLLDVVSERVVMNARRVRMGVMPVCGSALAIGFRAAGSVLA